MGSEVERNEAAEQRTAVAGAGVVGLVTAWQLRLTGHAVTIIDPHPGDDASYAAAGMLAPISEVQHGQEQLWEIMTASRAEYPEFIDRLERASGQPSGYRENGTLLIAADSGDRDAVSDLVQVQRRHGMEVQPLTSSALRRREPGLAPGLAKAWEVPSDHQVDPRQLMRCVTAALDAELDAEEFPGAGPAVEWVRQTVDRVERAQPIEQGILAQWGGEPRPFDRAVLSPGLGYSQIEGLPEEHPLQLRPVHGDVLRLRVRSDHLLPGETNVLHATVRARVRGRSVYLVPRNDGGLVIGASSREDGLAGTHAGSVAELLEDAITVLPAVRDMELEEITTRARPGTPDDRPFLGALTDDGAVVVSTGHHRHGILLAPLAARLTAELLNTGELSPSDAAAVAAMDPHR